MDWAPRRRMAWSDNECERCSTRRVLKSNCRTEEVEPEKFIRKCEKTEQVLRDCVGRPTLLLESNSEHTQEDVTDEVTRSFDGGLPFGSIDQNDQFSFPGLRYDINAIERNLVHGLNSFLEQAEEFNREFFQSFRILPITKDKSPKVALDDGRGGDKNNRS